MQPQRRSDRSNKGTSEERKLTPPPGTQTLHVGMIKLQVRPQPVTESFCDDCDLLRDCLMVSGTDRVLWLCGGCRGKRGFEI